MIDVSPAVEPPESPAPVAIQFPVPEQTTPPEETLPLPDLDESDEILRTEFYSLIDDERLQDLPVFRAFIRNFVVIIDNLTAAKLPQDYLFLHPPAGQFMVKNRGGENNLEIDPENSGRYVLHLRLLQTLNMDSLREIYFYLYPLFQEAYEELGYADRYFNDRLVEVISHLLETPETTDPVALVQPKVYYQYKDPDLEALSAGQKILLRTGTENTAIIKARLQELLVKLKQI